MNHSSEKITKRRDEHLVCSLRRDEIWSGHCFKADNTLIHTYLILGVNKMRSKKYMKIRQAYFDRQWQKLLHLKHPDDKINSMFWTNPLEASMLMIHTMLFRPFARAPLDSPIANEVHLTVEDRIPFVCAEVIEMPSRSSTRSCSGSNYQRLHHLYFVNYNNKG
jgi:hypothetical protein